MVSRGEAALIVPGGLGELPTAPDTERALVVTACQERPATSERAWLVVRGGWCAAATWIAKWRQQHDSTQRQSSGEDSSPHSPAVKPHSGQSK